MKGTLLRWPVWLSIIIILLLAVFGVTGFYSGTDEPVSAAHAECHTAMPASDVKPDFVLDPPAFVPISRSAAPMSPAVVKTYSGVLTGAAEVPPSGSAGTGNVTVTVDTVTLMMRVQGSFSGLGGTTTASHIHCCANAGTNAGVATETPTFASFPLGVTNGSFDLTRDMNLAASYNPSFVTAQGGTVAGARAALFAGLDASQAYFNIHTTTFGGGEIRAQLLPFTAAGVTVSGRVMTADGRGLRNALVTITDPSGSDVTVITGPLGRFTFSDVEAGTYIVSVNARRFVFEPRVLTVTDSIADLEFTPSDIGGRDK